MRILIFGGSGAGSSTLGRALASARDSQHFDSDDFFWRPSDPPFQERRPEPERLALMQALFLPRSDWVLSGSLVDWGAAVLPRLSHAVFLTLPGAQRLARLKARERRRYGARIGPGGDMAAVHRAFIDWAASYDDPGFGQRSRARHEAWAAEFPCPLLRLESARPVAALVEELCAWLDREAGAA